MSTYNHTPLSTGAAAQAATFNAVFSQLDAAIAKNNYAATAAPTAGDDTADGYTVGSRWIDVTNDRAYVAVDVTLGAAIWQLTGVPAATFNVTAAGNVFVGETANTKMTKGVTINQAGNDDEILALKSSDVAHTISATEEDTYAAITKFSATAGGATLAGYSAGTTGVRLAGRHTTDDTAKATTATGAVVITGQLGAASGDLGANANILAVRNNATTQFILDADGDSHQNIGTAWTNYHGHDDVGLIHRLAAFVTRLNDPIREDFGDWLKTNRAELELLKLVTFNDDGNHFVNMSKLTMLLVGAIQQQHARMTQLENRLLAIGA